MSDEQTQDVALNVTYRQSPPYLQLIALIPSGIVVSVEQDWPGQLWCYLLTCNKWPGSNPVSLTFRHASIPTCSAASFHRRVCRPKWNDGKIGPWSKRTLSSKMISQIPRARPHLERGKVSQTQRERSSQGCDFCRRKGGVWDKRAWLCWKKEACLLFPWCTYFPICTRPWDLWLPPPWAKELETLFYTIGLCPLSSTHEGSPNSHYEVSHKYPKLINHRVHTKGLLQTHAGFGIVTSVSVSPSELCLFD